MLGISNSLPSKLRPGCAYRPFPAGSGSDRGRRISPPAPSAFNASSQLAASPHLKRVGKVLHTPGRGQSASSSATSSSLSEQRRSGCLLPSALPARRRCSIFCDSSTGIGCKVIPLGRDHTVVLQPLWLLPGAHPSAAHSGFIPAGWKAYGEGQDALGSRLVISVWMNFISSFSTSIGISVSIFSEE